MSHDIPDALIAETNRMESSSPWAWLFEIYVNGGASFLPLTGNHESVTFNGRTYQPYPIDFGEIEESDSGDLPTTNLVIGNGTLEITALIEHYDSLSGEEVVAHFVNTAIGDTEARITHRYRIRETNVGQDVVGMELSFHPFFEIDFPYRRYLRRGTARFKSAECGWSDPSTGPGSSYCTKLLLGPNGCRFHGDLTEAAGETREHPKRFCGFSLIPKRRAP